MQNASSRPEGEAGPVQYHVRTWRVRYAHISLSMLALAWLVASKAQSEKGVGTDDPRMISYTFGPAAE